VRRITFFITSAKPMYGATALFYRFWQRSDVDAVSLASKELA
jgi:hypothetical protein